MTSSSLSPNIPYSQAELQHLFDYDRQTGAFTWRNPTIRNRHKRGEIAYRLDQYGTPKVCIGRIKYSAKDVIWRYVTGEDPNGVRNIDGDRLNNQFSNLGKVLIDLPYDFELTQELANKLFSYDADTGIVTRRLLISHRTVVGEQVGSASVGGYLVTEMRKRRVFVHRLAFLMMTGEWPDVVDHLNGRPSDNRWCNLRSATHSGNLKNKALPTNNTSGFCGVSLSHGKWRACITSQGIVRHLGQFDTKEEAIAARKAANIKYNFHPNHGLPQHEREKYDPETN